MRRDVPLELLGPLGCGVLTGAGAVMNSLKVSAGKSFAVFGTGSVGPVGRDGGTRGRRDHHHRGRYQRGAARNSPPASARRHTINPKSVDAWPRIMEITGSGVNFSLDTTALIPVVRNAVLCLAPRGACGILGAAPMGTELQLDEVHFMSGGRRLIGIVEGSASPDTFIPTLVDLHVAGLFPFDRMVRSIRSRRSTRRSPIRKPGAPSSRSCAWAERLARFAKRCTASSSSAASSRLRSSLDASAPATQRCTRSSRMRRRGCRAWWRRSTARGCRCRAVVGDHPLDAAHLSLDPVQPLDERVLLVVVAVVVLGVRVVRRAHPIPSLVLAKRRSRRLLVTTKMLEPAIAAAAIIGFRSPATASGIAATL